MADVDLDHGRAAREDERLRELLPADRAEHRLHGAAPVRVERAAEVADAHAGEAAQHPVDQRRRERPPPRVASYGTASAGDVRAGVDGGEELRDVLGLVLEVTVHRDEDVAAGAREAGVHRRMLAEVAREADGADARIAFVERAEPVEGVVAGAVVDDEELEGPAVDGGDGPLVELVDRPLLVQHRHDDRQLRLTVHWHAHPRLASRPVRSTPAHSAPRAVTSS